MIGLKGIALALAATLCLAACSPDKASSNISERRNLPEQAENIASFPIEPHQWHSDPDCFEVGAHMYGQRASFIEIDVEKIKLRSPRIFQGYFVRT
ncbi:hypothetical protein EOE18_13560 [Novosphingobium umbonatum]|uniref:Uncharacterized protein n=1 Tax=Novosphingobium umbonatum TaxID=1908524 RepID=A0A3S2VBV0_9SPHN|nr:hypothetical protein [Novosphingobium umbonatum]RVU03884.1 hypothetical protein EOE18_13560 [Novosphingobium umbonatum]